MVGLTETESEKGMRLGEVWADALRVWKTEDEARAFLHRQHPLFDNHGPIDLALDSATGAALVRDALGRLEHGTAV